MEGLERALFCLEQGFELQFRLGPTLQGRDVRVFTNYPADVLRFHRLQFQELTWIHPDGQKDDCDRFCKLDLTVAGTYQYYFSCGDQERVAGGYIVVDPLLRVGPNDQVLPLDRISCQTYQARRLGPLDSWLSRIQVTKEAGYNMIHLTPLQKLGSSGLCSSISEHLELNSAFSGGDRKCSWDDVGVVVETLRRDWNMLCISDVVYDRTAADGAWISRHPECGFNLLNSPGLKPAWLLDRALWHFSCQVADGRFSKQGLPAHIQDEGHMTALRGLLFQQVFFRLRLFEFQQVNVDEAVEQFRLFLQNGAVTPPPAGSSQLKMLQDPEYRRFGRKVDLNSAVLMYSPQSLKPEDMEESCRRLRSKLEEFNWEEYSKMTVCTEQVLDRIVDQVRSERLAVDGPQLGVVSRKQPLCPRYFTFPFGDMSLSEETQLLDRADRACLILAYDAVLAGDEPRTPAEPDPETFLRRQLLVRGHDVKLRYGATVEDCPELWAHMTEYTRLTARIFSGLCLLHCSSTPLHVMEAMLAAARAVRPNLYVTAELLPGSPLADSVYVNRLGITSLVRGVADRDGGDDWLSCFGKEPIGAFIQPSLRPLTPAAAHVMLKDVRTNDERGVKDPSVYNILVDSTLAAMACCATGSSRGYDELLLHQVSGTTEAPDYACWNRDARTENHVHLGTGIMAARLVLNRLHQQLSAQGFTQVAVKQLGAGVVAVTRHCPSSHRSVVALVRRATGTPDAPETPDLQLRSDLPPIVLPGQIQDILFEAETVQNDKQWRMKIRENLKLQDSTVEIRTRNQGPQQEVLFQNIPPGYVIIFRAALDPKTQQSVTALRQQLVQFSPQFQAGSLADQSLPDQSLPDQSPPAALSGPLVTILSRLSLTDMNRLLYRCHGEEAEDGRGCYSVPCWGPLVYAGLQGLVSVLAEIRPHNDLHHPFYENLRRGDWIMDYIVSRLLATGGAVAEVGCWFDAMFGLLKRLPRDLLPSYFDAIIQGAYSTAVHTALSTMSSFVRTGSSLVKQLALGSVQMCAAGHSWTQLQLSPGLKVDPRSCVSLAAGLPHFSVGTFGCWSRDSFMSFRGLLLLTGRHQEARNLLLLMASSLRYGLIPNLLSQAGSSRYNSRDAVWWFLQCVQDYCVLVPQGRSILQDPVSRVYPSDQVEPQEPGAAEQPLYDVIQEVMQRHMEGICFREDNAGPQLDNNMKDQGFNVEAGVDRRTGFVYGGNAFNCGTWMDKMGESDRAQNRGVPATPRDGSAVEIVGLSKSAVRWIAELHRSGHFPYQGVSVTTAGQTVSVSYEDWNQKIQEHFEENFYISQDPEACRDRNPDLVHKRGIYKDSLGASSPWCDYQLRPNFTVAMVVAPELFQVQRAWNALSVAEDKLLGPLGMKTLDPDDLVYCGVYDNDRDDDNFQQAKGFNYHQGPEWLWPLSYFLRAMLYFSKRLGDDRYSSSVNLVKQTLSRHTLHLQRSPWKGLPELTNEDGRACPFSCQSHAPSMASLLELLYQL